MCRSWSSSRFLVRRSTPWSFTTSSGWRAGSCRTSTASRAAASVQAAVAHLYQLTTREFEHVLATFPLIPQSAREQAMQCFLEHQETASK